MVNIPIAGNVPGPVVGIAVVGGIGGLGYAWYRNKKKQAAVAAAATAPVSDGSNPVSDYGYGAYGNDQYGYGAYTYGGTGNYYGYGGYNAGVPVPPSAPGAETNAQWSQNAVKALTAQNIPGDTVLAALGVYLTGGPANADQERIINSAIAAEGYPPVPGAGGYPPAIHNAPQGGQGGGGGGNTVVVPNVTGMGFGNAYNTLTRAGLTSVPGHNGTHAAYVVTGQAPKGGTQVTRGSVVRLTVPGKV